MEMLNKTVMDGAGLQNFDHTATKFYPADNTS